MYLGWKTFLALTILNLVGGIANALDGDAWWSFINGFFVATSAAIALDEYLKRERGGA